VLLWSDDLFELLEGKKPEFPQAERKYFVESVRYVYQVIFIDNLSNRDEIPQTNKITPEIWAVTEKEDNTVKRSFCSNMEYNSP